MPTARRISPITSNPLTVMTKSLSPVLISVQFPPMEPPPAATRHLEVADSASAGRRLDRFLAARLPALSRTAIKRLILDGRLSLGAETIMDPSRTVKQGESYLLEVPPPAPARPEGQAMALEVLHEDDDILVLDKPAGLVVHPAPGHPDRTLVNALIAHCGQTLSGIGGERRPGIVHRLDKDTSGVMVVAKNDAAHRALAARFARHDIAREYRALVWGRPNPPRGRIEGAIGRDSRNRKRMAVVATGGKPARTHYSTLSRFDCGAAELACRLDTGRTHQIRVHLAHLGHPVIGDALYARARPRRVTALGEGLQERLAGFSRQALHAGLLGFVHPTSGEALEFHSAPPADYRALAAALADAG